VVEVTQSVRYTGSPALASAVAQTLAESGIEVSWTPPLEQRGLEWLPEGVTVYYLCKGGDTALAAALDLVRERLGRRGTVEVDEETPDEGPDS